VILLAFLALSNALGMYFGGNGNACSLCGSLGGPNNCGVPYGYSGVAGVVAKKNGVYYWNLFSEHDCGAFSDDPTGYCLNQGTFYAIANGSCGFVNTSVKRREAETTDCVGCGEEVSDDNAYLMNCLTFWTANKLPGGSQFDPLKPLLAEDINRQQLARVFNNDWKSHVDADGNALYGTNSGSPKNDIDLAGGLGYTARGSFVKTYLQGKGFPEPTMRDFFTTCLSSAGLKQISLPRVTNGAGQIVIAAKGPGISPSGKLLGGICDSVAFVESCNQPIGGAVP